MSTRRIPATSTGELIRPGDAGYERARRVWNGAVDRRRAFIAPCRTAQDVVDAIDLAHGLRLTLSIRGRGIQPIAAATSERMRDQRLVIADGPFAETKEQVLGMIVVDCKDLDGAMEVAAKPLSPSWARSK